MSSLQFVIASIGSALIISAVSLLWPKFTAKPVPPALTQVKNVVEQTSLGRQAAQVLGVSDAAPTPVDLQQWAAQQGNAILGNITNSAQQVVITSVVRQIAGQIDKLSPDQKQQLQEVICASPSAVKQ